MSLKSRNKPVFQCSFSPKFFSIQQHHLFLIGIFHILYLRLTVAALLQVFKLLILGKFNHISL